MRIGARRLAAGMALITAALALGPVAAVRAQAIPLSQPGTVSQRVGVTDITVEYNRPVARGRVLFGSDGVVKWDRMWHPGADSATRIRVSRDVTFEGQPLQRGEYSLWLIPRESVPWTVILSRDAHVFHTRYPGRDRDALRVEVAAEAGAHMETLAYYFPVVARDAAVLRLHWGDVILPLRISAPVRP